jgi:hypothetical protein
MKASTSIRFHDFLRILVKGYQCIQYSSTRPPVNPPLVNKKNYFITLASKASHEIFARLQPFPPAHHLLASNCLHAVSPPPGGETCTGRRTY